MTSELTIDAIYMFAEEMAIENENEEVYSTLWLQNCYEEWKSIDMSDSFLCYMKITEIAGLESIICAEVRVDGMVVATLEI